jgi:hypothetical protein
MIRCNSPGRHRRCARLAAGESPLVLAGGGGTTTFLHIPRDTASQPWRLHVEATQPVRVCR